MCHGLVDIPALETRHGVVFNEYFAAERRRLDAMQSDGLVELDERHIALTPVGQLLMRNVAMVFDAYLDAPSQPVPMSRVI
jgi:oxygen-independent coproporphyrinogen-3 oxidase